MTGTSVTTLIECRRWICLAHMFLGDRGFARRCARQTDTRLIGPALLLTPTLEGLRRAAGWTVGTFANCFHLNELKMAVGGRR